jgi:hypothetical protein
VSDLPPSPHVTHITWGRVTVDGHGTFKDVKLFPGGARAWDWNETGTEHSPGIQPSDIEELLAHGTKVVILGTGMLGRLKVTSETLDMLESRKVRVHVLKSKEAVRVYNEVRETEPVGALIHSTC